MPNVTANGIQIEYDTFGADASPPLLLIMGVGAQMILWDAEFCELLAERGHFVIRFDNRDVGLSTKFEKQGHSFKPAYTLGDMADDAVGLLDALGIAKAHICGASMGGLIAQIVAYRYPERVLSLTSMMSSTGNPKLPQMKPAVLAAVFKPVPTKREANIEHNVKLGRMLWSPGFPFDEERFRKIMAESYDRSYYPQGFMRQSAAVLTHGYRKSSIESIRVPTLVIHGDQDPLVSVEGGRETARLIPEAKLMIVKGMGHDMPRGAWPEIIDAIDAHTKQAGRG